MRGESLDISEDWNPLLTDATWNTQHPAVPGQHTEESWAIFNGYCFIEHK